MVHQITPDTLTLEKIEELLRSNASLELSSGSKEKIQHCRNYLEKKLEEGQEVYYGINTGFGSLCNTVIEKEDIQQLQENLVMSHACGVGEEVPAEIVKLMLLLKIHALSFGHSGVRVELVEQLIAFYNNSLLPVVYQQGSLGASGDLAPLSHLTLPLTGRGEVRYKGERMDATTALEKAGMNPIQLQAKEGLAMINGTQFMSAYAVMNILQSKRLLKWADTIAAISVDGFDCRLSPFYEGIHRVRPHKGQQETAATILQWLDGSQIAAQDKTSVQDPYSFRCIPQVHGATKDAIDYAMEVVEKEVNAVTDNPIVFPEEDKIVSGGNFHGQPLALILDHLAIAMAEVGAIAERRTYKLLSGQRGLPEFLVAKPGLHSGLMIPQYTAASMVSQNKQLCTPASVDSIDSSNGQEDHVSMGGNAATKAHRVVENVQKILAIELLTAAQAIDLRKPKNTSERLQKVINSYRENVPFIEKDRELSVDIRKSVEYLKNT